MICHASILSIDIPYTHIQTLLYTLSTEDYRSAKEFFLLSNDNCYILEFTNVKYVGAESKARETIHNLAA